MECPLVADYRGFEKIRLIIPIRTQTNRYYKIFGLIAHIFSHENYPSKKSDPFLQISGHVSKVLNFITAVIYRDTND
ncbi:uncharacterized protein OCT59_014826 [Rhizophagus irregularis]|uniref:uncharacterized protein n=1 Tax=Rhizophagus irregularis TaxID=588596 RepID=UPI003316DB44|nr:hypothetical protein OCT59_014826 [Rhizophagus irregularis]